jgi:cellobiose PTS system EIIA component
VKYTAYLFHSSIIILIISVLARKLLYIKCKLNIFKKLKYRNFGEELRMEMGMEQIVMGLIISSGEAKAYVYEALEMAKQGKYDESDKLMEKANEVIDQTHNLQTSLLQREASGDKIEISILFVHAQDHLMTTITEKNLINEIIELRKVINPLLKSI